VLDVQRMRIRGRVGSVGGREGLLVMFELGEGGAPWVLPLGAADIVAGGLVVVWVS